VNDDGFVTIRDLLLLARQLGRGRYDARYDANGDGLLNVRDLLQVLRLLGRRC
jgi:hypothetical protein